MRKRTMKIGVVVALALGAAAGAGFRAGSTQPVWAQVSTPGASPGTGTPAPPIGAERLPEPDDPYAGRMKREQAIAQQDDRRKKMVLDADRLLQLATDLKIEVDKSTRNETSVSAYNKADQIERLAHDVKQRLKN